MKIKTHIVVTTILLGHLALPVASTHAGGITPVPKLVAVTESQALYTEGRAGDPNLILVDSGQPGARGITGLGYRDLAINSHGSNRGDFNGTKIYIADAGTGEGDGRILRVLITPGGPPYPVTTMFGNLTSPNGIAFDRRKVLDQDVDFLYWSDKVDKKIYWTNGTDIDCVWEGEPACSKSDFATTIGAPGHVRVCSANDRRCDDVGKIYWTELPFEATTGTVQVALANTPGPGAPFVTGLSGPVGLSIGKNWIYWTDTDQIGRSELDGPGEKKDFVQNVPGSVGIGIGFQGSNPHTMFWTRTDQEKFKKRAIDVLGGGNPLASNPGPVTGVRVLLPPGLIPTISTWGAVAMMLLVLTGGTIAILRRRTAVS